MSDEAAILLRVSAFGIVAGIAYWVVSGYEPLGSLALLALGAGSGFAALILILERRRQGPSEPFGDLVRRAAGIPPHDAPSPSDLSDDDLGVLPSPSVWPFAGSLGLAIAATGLIYGLWLLIVGGGLFVLSIWGWLAAIRRETAAGVLHDDAGDGS